MPASSRLELASSSGDQTLSRVKHILHPTSGSTKTAELLEFGLEFAEGQAVVMTDFIQANKISSVQDQGEPGTVFVGVLPENLHLGYAVGTTSQIDRRLKTVSGAPLRYASSRDELSLYTKPDTEVARLKLEADLAGGFLLEQHSRVIWGNQYLAGHFIGGTLTDLAARHMAAALEDLQPLDFDRIGRLLEEAYRPASSAHAALAATAIRDIVIGTAESVLMSRVRTMRWQGLARLGYRFYEGDREVNVAVTGDMAHHRHSLDELGRKMASSQLFTEELEWLKTYAAHSLHLMKMEAEGDE